MNILITGGAGFIGCNAARHFISRGHRVTVLDDLSRPGSERNLAWLQGLGGPFTFARVDIRDWAAVERAFREAAPLDVVLHLAAQVAVTTSVANPREDFEVNAQGTLSLLEAARCGQSHPIFLYASTNKVYGTLEDVAVAERDGRYSYRDLPRGVPESHALDFHSPYGCSKGAADQYVLDYARIYGLPTVSFRQSCIYGERQFGVEDQGWVAWFTIAAVLGLPITIYGDGKQVRDVLDVADLIRLYELAIDNINVARGKAYNVGGGSQNQVSLLELLDLLEQLLGRSIPRSFDEWRPGDQRVFVADTTRAAVELGWRPEVDYRQGVERLLGWVQENQDAIQEVQAAVGPPR